jgi:hypothetical protein
MQMLMSSLLERFESFVTTLDGFESIDSLLHVADPKGIKRADYLVQNRHIIIEQKVLRSNPIGRPQRFVDKLASERGILIYGRVSTAQIFSGQPDTRDLQRKMVLDLARVIDDDVADADKQTAETRRLFNIPNALGVLLFLNESADALRPDVIHFALRNSFHKKHESDALRYTANECVVVISEANVVALPSFQRGSPIFSYLTPQNRHAALFEHFSDTLMKRWADFNNAPLLKAVMSCPERH